jgi:hypothetical protein
MDNAAELPAEIRPFIQQGVQVAWEDDTITLGTHLAICPISGDHARQLGRLLPLFDGTRTLIDLARVSGLDLEEVRALVEPLYCEAFLGERTDEAVPALLFYEHSRNCGPLWQSLSTWQDLLPEAIASRHADAKLILGLLIEEWHYVASNPIHASAAVLNAKSPRTRFLWAQFAAEEYPHGTWLEEGLTRMLSREELYACRPLPGTAALCGQLRWTAHASELGYAACLAQCEQSNASRGAAFQSNYYASLKGLAVLPEEVFEPYERHALTDVQAGHLEFTRVPFEERGVITLAERLDVLGHVWDHVRAYELFYRNIYEFYGSPDTPRLHTLPGALLDGPPAGRGGRQGSGSTRASRSSLV